MLNSVDDRIVPVGVIHKGDFAKYLASPFSLVVMDCEGAEFDFLDPSVDPILKKTHILVEVHEEFGSWREIESRNSAVGAA